MSVQSHYENHLAAFYAWMSGNFETKQQEQQDWFASRGVLPRGNKTAIDLGAGHGLQSVSLAKLGFTVFAVDFNQHLLSELNARAKNLPIRTVLANLKDVPQYATEAELITCMGDTLTHLESVETVKTLIGQWFALLPAGGRLALSFRDLTEELFGEQRFIPIKADDNRIHTCFLEYAPGSVRVYDQLLEKSNGEWIQKVSSYRKLRMGADFVKEMLTGAGFRVMQHDVIARMQYLLAEK
ncbi:methyltransferase domain-containing protein [uncultured Chitinophaga sp.]|uniref:class I SAM-dependent methyltransferase n=1 Tax=uncultured Chitinophaga sp. TaxID=339340 RepID=UPI00260BE439|nr:methyltransferase domain-containing protein [uncultured Chitinophaga sp.]